MKLLERKKTISGISETYVNNGNRAVITSNFGILDKKTYVSVDAVINGKYKQIATRMRYEKAIATLEEIL